MKLPNKISTITELRNWINELNKGKFMERKVKGINEPDIIEIEEESKLRAISEFGEKKWKYFCGTPIKYCY